MNKCELSDLIRFLLNMKTSLRILHVLSGFLSSRECPTQPSLQWVPGAHFPGLGRPGREAYHRFSDNGEVENACSYTAISPCVFMQ